MNSAPTINESDLRDELQDAYRVFYVTAWGYAADHLFGWFPKALNCHRDVFALLAHEGSRPKYMSERTRGERPGLVPFTEFMNDMGMTYSAIGDCYSYRAGQMSELLSIDRYSDIPVVNLVRHPMVWLEYYVRWRASNMRMREGAMDPLEWEWKTACHGYFECLGLPSYERDDIEVWASYQGMFQLNHVLDDIKVVKQNIPVERVADEPETFHSLVRYLCRGTVAFDQADTDMAYSMRDSLFRGESPTETDPAALLAGWPGWKVDAFRKLVSRDALDAYTSFGYDMKEFTRSSVSIDPAPGRLNRSLFVSSVPKSGTWLLREILESLTELKAHEPQIAPGVPDYENEMLIDFPPGTFFSWHSILAPRTVSFLNSSQTRNIFLIRNVYDILLSMFNHLSKDVDSSIGRSVGGEEYFKDKSIEQCMTLMISGFASPEMTWLGAEPLLRQMDSLLAFKESGFALILAYEDLVQEKGTAIRSILNHLELKVSSRCIREVIRDTDKDRMRSRLEESGHSLHVTSEDQSLGRDLFCPYHKEMIDRMVLTCAPSLPARLAAVGMDYILHLQHEEMPERPKSLAHEVSSWLDDKGIGLPERFKK
jgi:hypothetical protein